jgi:hypothetical protein
MDLIYPEEHNVLPYNKLEDMEFTQDNPRQIFIFPDIEKSFPTICPKNYYVTSGEAIQKTDRLLSDVQKLLKNLTEFRKSLLKTKGDNAYLELTKCEDGVFSGNIVARKNPKVKKD